MAAEGVGKRGPSGTRFTLGLKPVCEAGTRLGRADMADAHTSTRTPDIAGLVVAAFAHLAGTGLPDEKAHASACERERSPTTEIGAVGRPNSHLRLGERRAPQNEHSARTNKGGREVAAPRGNWKATNLTG